MAYKHDPRFYSLDNVLSKNPDYIVLIGERSNGKTTAPLIKGLEDYMKTGRKLIYVRRHDEDIKGSRGALLYNALTAAGRDKDRNLVSEITDGQFVDVKYYNRAWYLVERVFDDEGEFKDVRMKEPFAHAISLNNASHDKSFNYGRVGSIVYDEFIDIRGTMLPGEINLFFNTISTIVRHSDEAKIYLVANTITWNHEYFDVLGVKVKHMVPGDIQTFDVSRHTGGRVVTVRVSVEYCRDSASRGGKPSDKYFAFDDPRLGMITDGKFAIPHYPECPHEFTRKNVKVTYWVLHRDEVIRLRLMKVGREMFVFADKVLREMYEEYKDDKKDIFYSLDFSSERNHFNDPMMRYLDPRTGMLVNMFLSNRVFFDDKDTGENVANYITMAQNFSVLSL